MVDINHIYNAVLAIPASPYDAPLRRVRGTLVRMDDLLGVQAAAALGISPNAVRVRIRKGHLRATRIGARTLVIERAEVERVRAIGRAKPWGLKQRAAPAGRTSDRSAPALPHGPCTTR